jgi:hypothetical protein
LVGDADGCHPALFNDRRLKGTMSEAELDVLRARRNDGKCSPLKNYGAKG